MINSATKQELWRDLRAAGRDLMVAKGPTARAACKQRMAHLSAAIAASSAAPTPDAPAAASTQENDDMARGRTARAPKDDDTGEIKSMDLKKAKSLYFHDIKPGKSAAAAEMQGVGQAYKAIDKECHIRRDAAQLAIKTFEREDTIRDEFLRGFCAMLNDLVGHQLVTFHSNDLVDQAQSSEAPAAPSRPKPKLVTPPPAAPDDSDLATGIPFTEASEEELTAQKGRGKPN